MGRDRPGTGEPEIWVRWQSYGGAGIRTGAGGWGVKRTDCLPCRKGTRGGKFDGDQESGGGNDGSGRESNDGRGGAESVQLRNDGLNDVLSVWKQVPSVYIVVCAKFESYVIDLPINGKAIDAYCADTVG